jgi:AAA domain
MFVVNNNHCYPITDEMQRRHVIRTGSLTLQAVEFSKIDMEAVSYYEGELSEDEGERISAMTDFVLAAEGHVVLPIDTLEKVARGVIESTNTLIEHFHYYGGFMVGFLHPTKEVCVIAGRDFQVRRAICQDYFKKHKVIDFVFKNQSWGEIGRVILDNCYTGLPKSQYSPDMKMVFEKYPIRPYRMCVDKDAKGVTSIGKHRCYTSILMNNGEPWNIFGGFDYIRPYFFVSKEALIAGEYYIAKDFYMGRGSIFISKGFYPMAFIKYALDRNFITGTDLTYAMFADQHLKADTFKKFAEDLYAAYSDDSKALINYMVGCFAALYHRTTLAGVTTDFDTAMATIAETPNGALHEVGDLSVGDRTERLFIIPQNEEFMKDAGDMPLYRQVIAASIVELDKMVEALEPERIIAYNTDSIKVAGSYNYDATKTKTDCAPGEFHVEDKANLVGRPIEMLDRFEEYKWEATRVRSVTEDKIGMDRVLNQGALVLGMPGCGKSELIVSLWGKMTPEQREKTIVTSYTNASVENLKGRKVKPTAEDWAVIAGGDLKVEAQTLSSLLWNGTNLSIEALEKYDRITLDEFSMLPPYEMGLLLNAHLKFGLKVICVGDQNQCKPPVDNWVRYVTNPLFVKMCGCYNVTMIYKPGFARYDEVLYVALVSFLKDRTLSDWACSEVESYQNICFSNDKRRQLNKACLACWVKEHSATLKDFGFPVCVGLPVLASSRPRYGSSRPLRRRSIWTRPSSRLSSTTPLR